jgi:alkanesulfonate monooxygenase SsuD/methylene tetrahydromethanopterin reductase-like flavin-dependent oxidoreductase (luciferase family)
VRIGYFLSSEEFDPRELIRQARMAEGAGFQGLWISDHYHPWNEAVPTTSTKRPPRSAGRRLSKTPPSMSQGSSL